MSSDTDGLQYYYCFKHQTVEGKDGCRGADRMGPYDTPEEAGRALEIAEARNEAWDNDPTWNDDVDE
ncbi:hypothetical protein D9V41_08860 [Aeromicrobium phragmitis]|uniref:SPOR domain-containing protein n=1 Tax=Aeromicrobium phragmitis TaxID=2478914 RepID=A0A3L8PLA8_9ACTN|nr:hypothetical protein [Aeromicrobium phragmitis]RLV55994.1 hypothetical protein D9V41_08860 [Aeromicrobium phragmitis]